jgi:putative Holliday junction resolvase
MARILAIDYGTRRTGLAVTDPEQRIANGLVTLPTHQLLAYLKDYLEKETVECVVIGDPKKMDNTPSSAAKAVADFIKKLTAVFPELKIITADERFTSRMAFQTMIDSGLKKKDRRDKEMIDMISATIILQSYLESRESGK